MSVRPIEDLGRSPRPIHHQSTAQQHAPTESNAIRRLSDFVRPSYLNRMAFETSATSLVGTSNSPSTVGQGSRAGSSSSLIITSRVRTSPVLVSITRSDTCPRVSPAPSSIGRFRISRPKPDGMAITLTRYPEESWCSSSQTPDH